MKARIVAHNSYGTFRGETCFTDDIYKTTSDFRELLTNHTSLSFKCDSGKFVIFAYEILKNTIFFIEEVQDTNNA